MLMQYHLIRETHSSLPSIVVIALMVAAWYALWFIAIGTVAIVSSVLGVS